MLFNNIPKKKKKKLKQNIERPNSSTADKDLQLNFCVEIKCIFHFIV